MKKQLKGIALLLFGIILALWIAGNSGYLYYGGILYGFIGLICVLVNSVNDDD